MKGDDLSHEEVWDDSALQNSWDDALAEYKKYHSMAAKGIKVDLSELARNKHVNSDAQAMKDDQEALAVNSTSNATTKQPQTIAGAQPASNPTISAPSTAPTQAAPATTTGAPVVGSAMPQTLLNTGTFQSKDAASENDRLTMIAVQDEGMKNLMMSWYYAGYYTGLLEGQQKAFASMQEGG